MLTAHWPPDPRRNLLAAGAAASELAEIGGHTRLVYPRGSLPGVGGLEDPFTLLEVKPVFGLVGLPSPGWSAGSRRIGFALNAFLYAVALSGPQMLFISDLVVWGWLHSLLGRRRKRLVLELEPGIVPGPDWARAAAQASGVVCHTPEQFEALVEYRIPAERMFLSADRRALARRIFERRQ